MKTAIAVVVAVAAGGIAAQLGLEFAPDIFVTYRGTVIVVSVMLVSGLTAAKIPV